MEHTNQDSDNTFNHDNWNQNDIVDEQPPPTNNNFDIVFADPKSKTSRNDNLHRNNVTKSIQNTIPNHMSTCRTLQRKLEMKVERAKRNYSQFNQNNADLNEEVRINTTSASANLIPISRLQIPGVQESVPLVEYRSENSEEDEVISTFFPKSKSNRKIDLTDTFSIQEMTIESDSDDESGDSQNLELLPPTGRSVFLDRIISYICCSNSEL